MKYDVIVIKDTSFLHCTPTLYGTFFEIVVTETRI